MTTLTIRNIEPSTKERLRMVAAAHGRSMEEEVRVILRNALAQSSAPGGLGTRVHSRFAAIGGVALDVPARTEPPRAASFGRKRAR